MKIRAKAVLVLVAVVCVGSLWRVGAQQALPDPVATFSILGYDPATGEIGGAVQSRVFSVGNGVLWAEAGVGVVATQAIVDVSYGPKGLALLRAGMSPAAIIKAIWDSDPDPRPDSWTKQGRQFAVIDAKGNIAAFTGPKATTWAGHKQGKLRTAQGNILAGEAVVANMVKAFEETTGPSVDAPDGRARSRSGRRRRHPRHAIRLHADRRQGHGRVAEQRCRPAPAGGRQPAAVQRDAPAGGAVESAARRRGSSGRLGRDSETQGSELRTEGSDAAQL